MKAGFIGLGTMGLAAAKNIRRAGFDMIVRDLAREKAAPLLAMGGVEFADSAAQVARCADAVVTMVFGPRELEEVVCGEDGLLAGGMQDTGWIDLTTGDPTLSRDLAAKIISEGGWAVDAPVTGSVDSAIRGDMILFVGGDDEAAAKAAPLLQAMGEIRRVGEIGCGQVAKLTNNLIWKINAAAIGEAMVTAKKAGMDIAVWWRAMQGGAADSFVLRHDAPSIFAGHYDPSFPLALCLKDWALIEKLMREVGVRDEIAQAAHARFKEANARYGARAGEMTVCKLLEEDAAATLRAPGEWMPPWEAKHRDEG